MLNRNPAGLIIIIFFLFCIMLVSCHKKEEQPTSFLVKIGENILTEDEVVRKIPAGLHPSDSTYMNQMLIDSWIKDHLLSEFAEERLYDLDRIDRLVQEYRDKLIVQEYLQRMAENNNPKINEEDIRNYYESHKNELKTEIPLVKGVFIKINSDNNNKNEIKRLLTDNDDSKIDILEKNWIDKALSYDYFKDKWVDWETITGLIPYRFGDPDAFLESNKYFETDYGNCTYYLQITDYLPSGSEQPLSYASGWISNLLRHKDIMESEQNLVDNLIKKSIKEKKMEAGDYDPVSHKMINKNNYSR